MNDWRLMGQEEYLSGKTLYRIKFIKLSDEWDHEHCAFCWAKFSEREGDLHEGYCTEPENSKKAFWICPECCEDFKEAFKWKFGS
ncbi:MAG: hypothetical protein IJK33_00810 [Clostridia bacterium]|jgi:hypothetical protein|nr:hypothetical protein [Clostridia bacterium]